jgi:hypothetical protein
MAGQVNLHEWAEFEQAINAAAADVGLDQQFVEKDYWVTTILRIVVSVLPGKTIFKGGTSLSKGWRLIDRFSEDIDLFVDPAKFDPALGRNGVTRTLKNLRDAVAAHPGLTLLDGGHTINGFSREDTFEYETLYDELPGVAATVRLEPGIQSGKQPTATIALNSIVAGFLIDRGQGDVADDLQPFDMELLHFRRTFVEKLFTVHGKIERLKADSHAIGRDARHYADIHVLAGQAEARHARLTGVRRAQARLRQDQPEVLPQQLPATERPRLHEQRRPLPRHGAARQDRGRLRARVRGALRGAALPNVRRCRRPSRSDSRLALSPTALGL